MRSDDDEMFGNIEPSHHVKAYEAAAGVRLQERALATRDVDLPWDTRKRLQFASRMKNLDLSMLDVLRKVDSTFEIRDDQLFTAVNAKGFEVDILRREAADLDPLPLQRPTMKTTSGQSRPDAQMFCWGRLHSLHPSFP
ncbi:GSU2403 family nucleotidyltransferase fold protein [Cupriavidus oxalaticus]|uniref:GSU2403 family nucleotidyltransferase fold protein n=1 Tax=Cupriavidus oxalaticus TaxID=96344 RepID=UPI003181C446